MDKIPIDPNLLPPVRQKSGSTLQSLIESLNWLAIAIRRHQKYFRLVPSQSISRICDYSKNTPRYLIGYIDFGVKFSPTPAIELNKFVHINGW